MSSELHDFTSQTIGYLKGKIKQKLNILRGLIRIHIAQLSFAC